MTTLSPMGIKIIKASELSNFKKIEKLAYEIILEFYVDLVPYDHNLFFGGKFQKGKDHQKNDSQK